MDDEFFGTILGYDVLRAYEPFNNLSSWASDHIDACVEIISDAHPTPRQIEIAILSIHELSVRDYVRFAQKIVDLYDQRLLTYWEFVSAIFPEQSWSAVVIENYDDAEIRALLEKIAVRSDIAPNEKSTITDILSGKAWEDLQEFRANCCSVSPPAPTPMYYNGGPRPSLVIPREFKSFTRLFSFVDFKSAVDQQAWISAVLETNSRQRNIVVKRFLVELLAIEASDAELEHIWQTWSPEFRVAGPGAMRRFLTQVRDTIPDS